MNAAAPDLLPPITPRALDENELAVLLRAHADRTHGGRIVDARDTEHPPEDHVPGAAWIPWTDRLPSFLLPPRGTPLVVIAPGAAAASRAARLTTAGWPASWAASDGLAVREGPPRTALWDVDPLLRRHVDRLGAPAAGPVLDVGSGSSREGVYLAQRGYRVVLVDRLPDALEIARARARHHGVEVESVARRLRRAEHLPEGPFAAVLDFRFLQRDVLAGLAGRTLRGGTLVLRCYARAEPEAGLVGSGPRNPNERLGLDEARRILDPAWRWIQPPRRVQENGALWITAVGTKGE